MKGIEMMLSDLFNSINLDLLEILKQFIAENNRKPIDKSFLVCEPLISHYGEYMGSMCFTIVEKEEGEKEEGMMKICTKERETENMKLVSEFYIKVKPFSKITAIIAIERFTYYPNK